MAVSRGLDHDCDCNIGAVLIPFYGLLMLDHVRGVKSGSEGE